MMINAHSPLKAAFQQGFASASAGACGNVAVSVRDRIGVWLLERVDHDVRSCGSAGSERCSVVNGP